jgi:hypothetical protein
LGGNDLICGDEGDDELFGGSGGDALSGDDGADTLGGGEQNDTLGGGGGVDNLDGGADADSLDGGAGSDKIGGGSGTDTAVYSSRTAAVKVTLDGLPDDGEKKENDIVRKDVESGASGAGNDFVNIRDGVKGKASCGKGRDKVRADSVDDVSKDCEKFVNLNPCKAAPVPVKMSRKGRVAVKVSCYEPARGTLQMRAKTKKKSRKLATIGRKSFNLKAGQNKTLKLKLKGKARRMVLRRGAIGARAVVIVREKVGARALRLKRGSNVRISGPKRRK